MAERATRAERKAQTRAALLEAAARLFAARGYRAVSVDDIAEAGGLTKGAVYSNFDSKEDLFLTLLEQRLAQRMEDVTSAVRQVEGAGAAAQAGAAAEEFLRFLRTEREWFLLWVEFWGHAVRDPELAEPFAARMRQQRTAVAHLIEESARALGIVLPLPAEQLATAANALSVGLAMEKLVDPDAVSDALYAFMLSSLFGVGTEPTA